MRKILSCSHDNAVTEVIAGMLLVIIAVVAFFAIAPHLYPEPPDTNPSIRIIGEVTDDGTIVLSHQGGNPLTSYRVFASYPNGTFIGSNTIEDDSWIIGEYRYPMDMIDASNIKLVNENISVEVKVFKIDEDGGGEAVFNAILSGKINRKQTSSDGEPILISSLDTNTIDEDLICFNDFIIPSIDASSYIYNWIVNGNPITNLLMPYDTNNINSSTDYSGNNNHGVINGANWNDNGIIAGAYEFDGIDDFIKIPYCDQDNTIDEISVETWIKTITSSGIIASYNRTKYWEISLNNGHIIWSVTCNGITSDLISENTVNDNNWHHIIATYDYSEGKSSIYIDGEIDNQDNGHNPGSKIGNGDRPDGYIGTSNSSSSIGLWETLTYDDFESGWGNYSDGGRDCERMNDYSHQGSYSIRLRDNNGYSSSFYHTHENDVHSSEYTSIKIDFWWMWNDYWGGWDYGEDWFVKYYDGNEYKMVLDRDYPSGFSEDVWYHEVIYINETDYNFPTDMKIRFQCSASWDNDRLFIDQVYVNATTGGSGSDNYSGIIDETKIYNRVLSDEQIYQNYLCTKDGNYDRSVIVSEETKLNDKWQCIITPKNSTLDDSSIESNILNILTHSGGEI